MYYRQKQLGFSLFETLSKVIVVLVVLILGVKLFPVYMENYSMNKLIASIDQQANGQTLSKTEVKGYISKWLATSHIEIYPKVQSKLPVITA